MVGDSLRFHLSTDPRLGMVWVGASVAVAYTITVHLVALWVPVGLVVLVFLAWERGSSGRRAGSG